MQNFFKKIRQKFSKPILFAIYGAVGCFLLALTLGEGWLALTTLPPSVDQADQAIVLLIDSSASMSDGKIDEVKGAASDFVKRRDLSRDQLAVVGFGGYVTTTAPLTNNCNELQSAIASLSNSGGTPMAEGIQAAVNELQSASLNRNQTSLNRSILLFTDGSPDNQFSTSSKAQAARSRGINLIAVATGDADVNYLGQVTGDPNLIFYASSGNFDQAFRDAEAVIYGRQLVESGEAGDYGVIYATLRIGVWTALLSIGISLALILGQNHYLRRRLLTLQEGGTSTVGSFVGGLTAGGIGQLLFLGFALVPNSYILGGILNWAIVGALIAGVISFFKYHLSLGWGLLLGGIAGAVGGTAFVWIANSGGNFWGSLVGAVILGVSMSYLTRSQAMGWGIGVVTIFFGSVLFLPIAGMPPTLEIVGRIAGWTILGVLVGGGTSFFVPNLQLSRALLGGSLGGSIGAIGFLVAAIAFGDILGRLAGAAILGFFIGLMIAWAEKKQLSTQAYIIVHWAANEQSKILLGEKPILIGSSQEAQIPLTKAHFFPVTARIFKEGETIVMEYNREYGDAKNMKKLRHELQDGSRRKLGNITLEVKSSVDSQTHRETITT
ncbi:VWA domain-containing protein [Synechococcus moorigangaii CMS01]|nr:VWA domain-containing protein [Synechococcus moorigangaii CMS01]